MLKTYLHKVLVDKLNMENSHKDRIKVYPHNGIGVVKYAPSAKGFYDPTWVILECDKAIVDYYSWFLQKKGITLESLMWGSHISIIRGEPILEESKWKYNEGLTINFKYGDLVTNGNHWWLEAESLELDEMRNHLGLTPHPKSGFHLTLGKIAKLKKN
jgi:hypothetical protein